MRIILLLFILITGIKSVAQTRCTAGEYLLLQSANGFTLPKPLTDNQLPIINTNSFARVMGDGKGVITIPVVFHVLYNSAGQNITEAKINQQLALLNKSFRKNNADTAKIPAAFKSLAADCEIEFKLATSDPMRRATNGIVRKYTSVKSWMDDDKMKASATQGSDAWDPQYYLNIWVCNLSLSSGYSSFPGSVPNKDGVVVKTSLIGNSKVLVHEAGHWLGLRHLWGDTYCGDDFVDDTPKQSTYTPGCPTGIRPSCGGGAPGDMYMNYMDFTSDACLLMFTHGQKQRMWSFFTPGALRAGITNSWGLHAPTNEEIPLPEEEEEEPQKPLESTIKVYPNPAVNKLIIDMGTNENWLGKTVSIYNTKGAVVMRSVINSKQHAIDISKFISGLYFVAGKHENGEVIKIKFIKN